MAVPGIAWLSSASRIVLLGVFTYTAIEARAARQRVEPSGHAWCCEDNGDATEVNCDTSITTGSSEPADAKRQRCPADLEPHRDRQGLGVVCVRFDV